MDVHLDGVVCYRYCEQSVIDTVNSKHIEVHLFFAAYSKLGANIDVVFMKEKKKSPLNNTVISTICYHKKKKKPPRKTDQLLPHFSSHSHMFKKVVCSHFVLKSSESKPHG